MFCLAITTSMTGYVGCSNLLSRMIAAEVTKPEQLTGTEQVLKQNWTFGSFLILILNSQYRTEIMLFFTTVENNVTSWGQDYKEKHKTRLKTNVKRTVLNNTKLRHFWAQIVSWAPKARTDFRKRKSSRHFWGKRIKPLFLEHFFVLITNKLFANLDFA